MLDWKKKALEWKEKFKEMRKLRNVCRKALRKCEKDLEKCEEEPDPLPDPDPDPDPDPTPDKKLSVENGKILYGGNAIKLCGVSRWEALWREYGAHNCPHDWGQYSLEWYENKLIESKITLVRHGGIKETDLLYGHCERMKNAGIIVEVTAYRAGYKREGTLVTLNDMGELAKLGNVFFDVNNEFSDTPDEARVVQDIAEKLKDQGCIISGGAWWCAEGKLQSQIFLNNYRDLDIITHHRDWNEQSFKETLSYGKPVLWNEYFAMKEGLSLDKVKELMRLAFSCGIQGVTYYGFRWPGIPGLSQYDQFDYQKILDYAGGLVK